MKKVERALISVFDKRGIVDFARGLAGMGIEIVSTGSTARVIREAGVPVREVSEITGFPEMLDGRVKTLHPRIHAGLLALRGNPDHQRQLSEHGIGPIDLVVVNLYPFVETIRRPGTTFEDAIENVDVGGPSMLRAAAKNFFDVAVVTDPNDYPAILEELGAGDRALPRERLLGLAQKAFALTAAYDGEIAQYLSRFRASGDGYAAPEDAFPPRLFMNLEQVRPLRYGENPHQRAAFYRWAAQAPYGLAAARQLQGKELSYNNLVDLEAAWSLILEFEEPAAAIIKHTNPCGAAVGGDLREAYLKARDADPVSAFGSVVAVNRPLDRATAEELSKLFVEAIAAPRIGTGAREALAAKTNLRLLEVSTDGTPPGVAGLNLRPVAGGLLVQDRDVSRELDEGSVRVVTSRQPTPEEWRDLGFAWKVARHVTSNAIVLASGGRTAGIGAGQMSRVDAVQISIQKAGSSATGAAMASDAFFPFRDGIDAAARAGVRAVIHPGGSRRDEEVIQAAEEAGMTMVFTGRRHFRH